jgi:hypothetical protein
MPSPVHIARLIRVSRLIDIAHEFQSVLMGFHGMLVWSASPANIGHGDWGEWTKAGNYYPQAYLHLQLPVIYHLVRYLPSILFSYAAASIAHLESRDDFLRREFNQKTMDSKVSFGPEGDQWHYERSTKIYDLTRGGDSKKFTISTTKGPPDTAVTIDPALTALVIVDMQNYFLDAKCRSHPTGLAAVDPTLAVIEKCRDVGVQVL